MRLLNTVCSGLVEVALILVITLALIAPVHAAFTTHLPVVQSVDTAHAIIAGDVSHLTVGEAVPVYRFNYSWKTPIGTGYVDTIGTNVAQIHVDVAQMHYDLSRNGIIHIANGVPTASVGSKLGFMQGDMLNIFQNGRVIGKARILKLGVDQSIIEVSQHAGSFDGLTVSSYTVPTEVTLFDNGLVGAIETIFIVGVLALYSGVYLLKRQSPFLLCGAWLTQLRMPHAQFRWLINIVVGIPFVWFLGTLSVHLVAYAYSLMAQTSFALFDPTLPYVWGALALLYYGYLAWTFRSPVLAFWHALSYKKVGAIKEVSWQRGLSMWALHLIIVYVFARTLFGFFLADVSAAEAIGSPHTMSDFFAVAQYLIWALTVVGCLIGYGYSVVSVLWGRFIRNLDFTVTGWLTNAFCYPLLGVVIWNMVPSFTGPSPIITAGPAFILMLVLGLLLNLLYMLSIFNLGTMFDLMADKGVRSTLFYSVIRHPNYMLEACMFFATEIVGLTSGTEWLVILIFFFLYWIRSEREDNFMTYSNPEYAPYTEKTPYKFIPGIY